MSSVPHTIAYKREPNKQRKVSKTKQRSHTPTTPTPPIRTSPSPRVMSTTGSTRVDYTNVPPEVLAANWPPEIVEQYLAEVSKDREQGIEYDDDEDMSSGSDDEDNEDDVMDSDSEDDVKEAPLTWHRADDIASDDAAFSSEDEFADDNVREMQKTRRALVLGRPAPALQAMRPKDLIDLVESYMKQLDDADVELAEVTGRPVQPVVRRAVSAPFEVEEQEPQTAAERVLKARQRSRKDICDVERPRLMLDLQYLAQELFRIERMLKRLRGM